MALMNLRFYPVTVSTNGISIKVYRISIEVVVEYVCILVCLPVWELNYGSIVGVAVSTRW